MILRPLVFPGQRFFDQKTLRQKLYIKWTKLWSSLMDKLELVPRSLSFSKEINLSAKIILTL